METKALEFMQAAIQLGIDGMQQNEGGPFGCVVVQNDVIIGRGNNKVLLLNDPTAHAEVVAIRDACKHLNSFQLTDCTIYTSCEPCPMCLGAIYWARPKHIYYANTREAAAAIGFDDSLIYQEISAPLEARKIPITQLGDAAKMFALWQEKQDKLRY